MPPKMSTLVAAAAVLLLAAALPAASAAEMGPLCKNVAAGMGLDEGLVNGFIASVPEPPSRGFCSWLTNNLTQTQACDYLTLLYFGLTGGGDTSPPECNATEAVAYQTMPVGGLTQLADARPLPLAFPDPEEIFAVEGASYYFLYDLARNAQTYTPCGNDPSAKLVLPPGWELDRTADLTYPNGPPLPIVFVLSNAETNQLLFLVRPTVGSREWSLNFAYNHTDDPAAQELFGDAQLSEGFSSIFFEAWPTVQSALEELVVNATATPEVWVAGYSMGAAVSMLAAFAGQDLLDTQMGEEAPVINSVTFSPPQVGDAAFANRFNELVNHRDLNFAEDLIGDVPCAPAMPACPATPSGLLGSLGIKGVETNQGNTTQSHAYQAAGGRLTFYPQDMPQDNATWIKINSMPLCWAPIYLSAAHLCSYQCYLSQFAAEPVSKDQCWLSAKPEGAPGSACWGFPNGWLTPAAVDGAAAAPASATVPVPPASTALRLAATPLAILQLAVMAVALLMA